MTDAGSSPKSLFVKTTEEVFFAALSITSVSRMMSCDMMCHVLVTPVMREWKGIDHLITGGC